MYSWKPGARVRTDADTVGRICEEMAKVGRLTAENLVEDSRPVDAPLHNEFTWDDAKAAESWRKQEAMQIINHLEIRIQDVAPVRAFIKLYTAEDNYHPTEVIVRDANSRDIMLRNAYQELAAFKRKYNALNELAKIFEAIDMMEGKFK